MTNFERFYITWYSRAIYFAREYVLSESDAENIVQDVFLHLYEHCDRLDAYTNLTAYLFTSIKNKCLDYLRKRVNEQEAVAEMQSEFDMTLRMKYDSLEILNTNFPDETDFCVVMFGLINVNILYYSFSTLYQMCNLRQSL